MDPDVFDQIVRGGGGSQRELARQLTRAGSKITVMGVAGWKKRGVPAEWVIRVERLCGVSRHVIRPDIYPMDGGYLAA